MWVRGQVDPRHGCCDVQHKRRRDALPHRLWVDEQILELSADQGREADDLFVYDSDPRAPFDDIRFVESELVGMRLDPRTVALVRERRTAEDVPNRRKVVRRRRADLHRTASSSASR